MPILLAFLVFTNFASAVEKMSNADLANVYPAFVAEVSRCLKKDCYRGTGKTWEEASLESYILCRYKGGRTASACLSPTTFLEMVIKASQAEFQSYDSSVSEAEIATIRANLTREFKEGFVPLKERSLWDEFFGWLSPEPQSQKKEPVQPAFRTYGCFTGNSMVILADGQVERIDRLQPGMEVISYDHATGRMVKNQIEKVIHVRGQPRALQLEGATAEIEVTGDHPFYPLSFSSNRPQRSLVLRASNEDKYVPIQKIRPGTELLAVNLVGFREPSLEPSRAKSVRLNQYSSASRETDVYTLQMVGSPRNFLISVPGPTVGIVVHNKIL